jgi:hypothetical protein
MNLNETIRRIKQRFPRASRSFIEANLGGFRPDDQESAKRRPLVSQPPGEDSRWYGAASRFEITFRIFSRRPCDYDGYDIKPIQDMLVNAAIIPDDKWSVLVGRVVSGKAHTEAEERTEIEVTPIP